VCFFYLVTEHDSCRGISRLIESLYIRNKTVVLMDTKKTSFTTVFVTPFYILPFISLFCFFLFLIYNFVIKTQWQSCYHRCSLHVLPSAVLLRPVASFAVVTKVKHFALLTCNISPSDPSSNWTAKILQKLSEVKNNTLPVLHRFRAQFNVYH